MLLTTIWSLILGAHSSVLTKPSSSKTGQLEAIRAAHHVPALGVARIANLTLNIETTGYRKWGNDTRVTNTDKWHLGSLTKSMTATLFALLIEEGLFEWDTALKDVVAPGVASALHPDYVNVTLDMLTTHTSGIFQPSDPQFYRDMWDPNLPVLQGRTEWARYCLSRPAQAVPGTTFNYSNTGYIILGHVMEHATLKPWELLLKEKILDPLNVGCGFGVAPEPYRGAIDEPWPHILWNETGVIALDPFDKFADLPKTMGPSGQVHCTLHAWQSFLLMHVRAHNGRGVPIDLPREAWIKLHTPRLSNYTYGGWEVSHQVWAGNGRNLVLHHTGSNLRNWASAWLDVEGENIYFAVSNAADMPGEWDEHRAAKAVEGAIEAVLDGRIFGATEPKFTAHDMARWGHADWRGSSETQDPFSHRRDQKVL